MPDKAVYFEDLRVDCHDRRLLFSKQGLYRFVMNRLERPNPIGAEADIEYLDGNYKIVRHGTFVRCAVTGNPIPLAELRYWSVDRQEAYVGPEEVLKRLEQTR